MREPQRDSLGREIRVDIHLIRHLQKLHVVLLIPLRQLSDGTIVQYFVFADSSFGRSAQNLRAEHTRRQHQQLKLRAYMLPFRAL